MERYDGLMKLMSELGSPIDLTPDGLRSLDKFNHYEYSRRKISLLKTSLASHFITEGSFFGDVIIRNLGGEWVYPSRRRWKATAALILLHDIIRVIPKRWILGYIYEGGRIRLENGNLVPVMKIAKWRLKGRRGVASLFEIYERIRTTGDWE